MKKEWKDIISKYLNVSPILINSNLVSFQNRKRLYWTNIPNVQLPIDMNINFQDYIEKEYDKIKDYKLKKTPSRIKMWGNGINGKCKNITNSKKINCLTLKQDRWSNSGLIEFEDFCRYLTINECEMAQNVPIDYTGGFSIQSRYKMLGNGMTVNVIAEILKNIK